jgi:IS1 family transposase/transposase-like protein
MDHTTCYCRSPQCPMYGQIAPRAQVKIHDWQRQGPRFRCAKCGGIVSATTGTAYAGIRTDLTAYLRGATALAEGWSIRATGRLLDVDKDTANPWLPVLGQPCQGVMNYFFRTLPLHECQLDALWTFIHKKQGQLTSLEKLAEGYGDAWVWIACSPVGTLVPAWGVGKRTLPHARRLLFQLNSATDGHIPFFTSDALPHYAEAFLEVYGVWGTPPRQGTRGRLPQPRRYPPPDWCYAVVIKERAQGRVVHLTTRIVYGPTAQGEAALRTSPVSRVITTYGVERNTLTIRQHARRMGRKGNAFSKEPDSLEQQLTLAFAYYHFVVPPRGLRQRLACPRPTQGDKGS